VLSAQPVHSASANQITGGRGALANAAATFDTYAEDSPIVALSAVQYFMKSLREIPFRVNLSNKPFP